MVSDIRVSDVMATLNEVMTTPHSRRHVHSG